ncbi:ribonuclease P protein component [Mycetocola tolaasinivorans]|uniref:Ribonuclease P protein component n=1 Tax=Mycetocola tolaasinivorans TaxID=76635 RepID=A0A3L7A5M1_9MICO|nr:ribonuclease P protein component [Mycetocola tolaasinivorans]RLP75228.1 ribonuclease P protein component [Mycetocola tolaasinivorans]
MLASELRITTGADYKRLVRRGRRSVGAVTVAYMHMNPNGGSPRFGFIVAKNVGNAVTRNRVRRRLKAASFELRDSFPPGAEIVYRAFPSAAVADYGTIRSDIAAVSARFVSK